MSSSIDIYTVQFRHGEPFTGNLRAFENLETLKLETAMTFEEVDGADDSTPDEDVGYSQVGVPRKNSRGAGRRTCRFGGTRASRWCSASSCEDIEACRRLVGWRSCCGAERFDGMEG
ncbi:hypothetical protein HO173_006694 [Letharia columbiana]|uniref:Uncharacterized protein n=1 Tax=Letharia columbiana TaxID=112416 RepID=A0A8H6FUK0_9LECA|nr:uncharacterized protein HO173_006694 [Letharia columbiana]KAF6235067.1 hypothetical protein HO173_006694 [Letharia columbiana]